MIKECFANLTKPLQPNVTQFRMCPVLVFPLSDNHHWPSCDDLPLCRSSWPECDHCVVLCCVVLWPLCFDQNVTTVLRSTGPQSDLPHFPHVSVTPRISPGKIFVCGFALCHYPLPLPFALIFLPSYLPLPWLFCCTFSCSSILIYSADSDNKMCGEGLA